MTTTTTKRWLRVDWPSTGGGRVPVRQYRLREILLVWAAAALPMGLLAWVVAPAVATGRGSGTWARALVLCLMAGLVWQCILAVALVGLEQRSLRWSRLRDALWLRPPRSPRTGRCGGWVWAVVLPFVVGFGVRQLIPAIPHPANRDLGRFLASDAGKAMFHGAWGWFAIAIAMLVFNTVLGEELLFRGVLLPRMRGVFGERDWVANGVLFAAYHVHLPWMMPVTLVDTFLLAYPTKRYRSAWMGIAVHSTQTVAFSLLLLTLVV